MASNSSDSNSSYCGIDSCYGSDLSFSSLSHHKCRLPQKRARLHTAQQSQAHSVPTPPIAPTHHQLRSIPSSWTKLELESCSPEFPDLYMALSHSQVPEEHGTIFVIVAGIDAADLHQMFAHGAKLSSFCSLDEAADEPRLLWQQQDPKLGESLGN
ncbi:hypothetical protein ARMGADRAFT_1091114 [Armillaria gallica]|uniref:Uncharacterized protein n=1 Tax=Armillaria gallica TaxID=47427 RepID=A0A2H3CZU4_ARMGA|nr:hypothetical protein ARMGADRAFT_1091114 [Armillaria gallica]